MKCPYCGYSESRVIDSRPAEEGATIRRRRECLACSKRFTTYEIIERLPLVVIKRDGSRQTFDKVKLITGMVRPARSAPSPCRPRAHSRRHRAGAPEQPRARDKHHRDRRDGHGPPQGRRRGRLRPLRHRSFKDINHLHGGAHEAPEAEGEIIRRPAASVQKPQGGRLLT